MKPKHLISNMLMISALLISALPAGAALADDDTFGPIVSDMLVAPNPATINTVVTITAIVDDSTTGASNIASAEFNVDGGEWTVMSAADGAFDATTEAVTATYTVTTGGDHEVCVRGTDALNNVGEPACTTLTGQYLYIFASFFPPIKKSENKANAPSVIPIKWRLLSAQDGSVITDRSSFTALMSYAVDCTTLTGDRTTAVAARNPGKSNLRNVGGGRWMFNWKTEKSYRHSCRMMYIAFSDGSSSPEILFRFR